MTCSICPAERYCRMLTGPMKGAHMMPLCLKGRSNRMGTVSYTHLDVYKRQDYAMQVIFCCFDARTERVYQAKME